MVENVHHFRFGFADAQTTRPRASFCHYDAGHRDVGVIEVRNRSGCPSRPISKGASAGFGSGRSWALEVLAVTGRPFSATLPRYEDLVPTVHLALRLERGGAEGAAYLADD